MKRKKSAQSGRQAVTAATTNVIFNSESAVSNGGLETGTFGTFGTFAATNLSTVAKTWSLERHVSPPGNTASASQSSSGHASGTSSASPAVHYNQITPKTTAPATHRGNRHHHHSRPALGGRGHESAHQTNASPHENCPYVNSSMDITNPSHSASSRDDLDLALVPSSNDILRTKSAVEHIQSKINQTKEAIKSEQTLRDENVNEYLKLASNADKVRFCLC